MFPAVSKLLRKKHKIHSVENDVFDEDGSVWGTVATGSSFYDRNMTSFLELPSEILHHNIMSFLHCRDIVQVDSAVLNQKLRHNYFECMKYLVVQDQISLSHIKWFSDRNMSPGTILITSSPSDCILQTHSITGLKWIKSIQLLAATTISPETICNLLHHCPNIQTLDLRKFQVLDFDFFHKLKHNLSLVELIMPYTEAITDEALVALLVRCPQLRRIHLDGCIHITSLAIGAIAQFCPQLRELEIDWNREDYIIYEMDEEPITEFVELFSTCTYLEKVSIGECVSTQALQALAAHCTMLKSISFYYNVHLNDEILELIVANNCGLTSLKLQYCHNISDMGLLAVAVHAPRLHTCEIHSCNEVSDIGIEAIFNGCRRLRHYAVDDIMGGVYTPAILLGMDHALESLSFAHGTLLPENIFRLSKEYPQLKKLRFLLDGPIGEPIYTSSAFCDALRNWPHLVELNVSSCDGVAKHITDEVIFAVVRNCRHLAVLEMCHNRVVTDKGFALLGRLPELRELVIDFCPLIRSTALMAIATGCAKLTRINLDRCRGISNQGIVALAQCHHTLRTVSLRGCHWLRNYAIQQLIRASPRLEQLDVADCPMITFSAVAALPQYCPHMFKLSIRAWFSHHRGYKKNKYYFDVVMQYHGFTHVQW